MNPPSTVVLPHYESFSTKGCALTIIYTKKNFKKIMPRNIFGRFHKSSFAIVDITFEPSSEMPEDFGEWLGDGNMVVEFQARGTYKYYGVNYIEFANFKNAPSWGEYFNNSIRPYYNDFERIA